MRWQRIARVVVALIGLGTAAATYVFTRPRQPNARPATIAPADPAANIQSGPGQDLRFSRDSQLVASITYASQRHYQDGRSVYEKLRLELKDGTVISANEVEARGKAPEGNLPAEWALRGDVRLTADNKTSLTGEQGTYNQVTGLASIPGAVAFTRGRVSGTGNGGTYERDSGLFKVLADAKIVMAADAKGEGSVEATSQSMSFVRAGKAMLFEGNPRLGRPSETLTADRSTVYLSDDEQQFRAIELRGNAAVAPAEAQTSALPEMRATNIDLAFYQGSQAVERGMLVGTARMVLTNPQGRRSIEAPRINFSTAPDGKTLTRLDAGDRVVVTIPASGDTPDRTISGRSLVASGAKKDGPLTLASFDGGAEFVEMVPATSGSPARQRKGTSQTLVLSIQGAFDAIDRAEFRQNVTFHDGNNITADADLGIYNATKGELELQPLGRNGRRMPHVQDGSVTVDSSEKITVNLNTHAITARQDVKTVRAAEAAAASTQGAGLFSRSDKWYGSAYEFEYRPADKILRYAGSSGGPARIWQSDSAVSARDITVSEDRLDLNATGQVDSTFLMTGGDRDASSSSPGRYHVTANTLAYVDASRTATYVGTPAVMKRDAAETRARTLVLTMAQTGRRLDRFEARTDVRATLSTGREGVGDELRYEASNDQYTLKGGPLTIQTRDAEGTCTVATGTLARFVGSVGTPDFPATDNPGNSVTRPKQPCRDLLKP